MKRVAIIQARMGSTRLPGKVMSDVGGATLLSRVVNRTRRSKTLDSVMVATSTLAGDDVVASHSRDLGVEVFRGDETDVLSRYYHAAAGCGAGVVVRVTADCPLIEPEIIDRVVIGFANAQPPADFACNVLPRTYPRGLDVQVASYAALERVWREARKPHHRVHVFPYVYENPEMFVRVHVVDEKDRSWMRWTVDALEDLEFVRAVYLRLGNDDGTSWREVLELLEREPELLDINKHVRHKALEDECLTPRSA